jgi:SET domain-containing protein
MQEYSAKGELSEMVYQDNSPIHGLGLFAKEDISSNTFIHETHAWIKFAGTYVNLKPNNLYNHSIHANCKTVKTGNIVRLESITSIKKGDELLVDYNKASELETPQKDWID